ncbi:MAG TPA: hypothetical protein VF615_16310 [Longimicrobiaceae bacterium]|jgi:hypothetical protein
MSITARPTPSASAYHGAPPRHDGRIPSNTYDAGSGPDRARIHSGNVESG